MFSAGNTLTLIVIITLHVRIANSLRYRLIGGEEISTQSCSCHDVYEDNRELACTFVWVSDTQAGYDYQDNDVYVYKLKGGPTNESCTASGGREVVNVTDVLDRTNTLTCGNAAVGIFTFNASAVTITVTFCKYKEIILLLPEYETYPTYCPETYDQDFCSNIDDRDIVEGSNEDSESTTTITRTTSAAEVSGMRTNQVSEYTTAITGITSAAEVSDTSADKILAASIAVVSIIIFIVAIVLVLLCCRRMSYRMNLKRGKQSNTPSTVIENSAYISVDNGVAASTNNIPVYAKPDKGNRQLANGATNSGYEKPPVTKPRDSGYEEATLSPIRHLVDDDISNKPPATPPRPRSAARVSTPADGYEEANLPNSNDNINTSSGMTNSSAGYEDNFVKPGGSSGYEDNFVTMQTGTKESIKYDHLKRKNGNDGKTGLDVEAAEGYGQVRSKSDLVDAEEYQHLTHDKKAGDREPGYGKLGKDRKS